MKKKRWIIPLSILLVIIAVVFIISYRVLNDKYKLTSEERTWINNNINNLQNVYIAKDENIFSKDGKGVFYTFLDSFANEYDIKLNLINEEDTTEEVKKDDTEEQTEAVNVETATTFSASRSLMGGENVFYKDHYVLAGRNVESIHSNRDLENKTIGVLKSELEYVKEYLKEANVNLIGYETFDSLNANSDYIIVPRMEYIDSILSNNLIILYHFNDISKYYTMRSSDDTFGRIINKYYAKWNENIEKEVKKEEFKVFTKALGIKETEIDKLLSVDYKYGFVNNSPYEVIMGGNYGGIVAAYLQEFSEFSGVYFDITKYNNSGKLIDSINKNKVDIYFDYNNSFASEYEKTTSGLNISYSIITNKNNVKMFDSVYGLINETVYVQKDSEIEKYLRSIGNIQIKNYDGNKELFKLNNKDEIIVIDSYVFSYYNKTKLSNYVSKYDSFCNDIYGFKVNKKYDILYNLMNKYINYLDESTIVLKGLNSHETVIKNGSILNGVAKYIILSILGVALIWFIVYKQSKKIRVSKRIKKDDKIRFLDDLTMLKNRAYLSDFIKTWNNNTIYPQTVIVVGLNKLQFINDQYGVEEGDKQIQAIANALIKTQLDNSDLMRSDGNEFVIYTVGYSQKQIINYIHKLTKEFKKLPYEYGAEFGFSIIENNLKTVEDALAEATTDMKNKKESAK